MTKTKKNNLIKIEVQEFSGSIPGATSAGLTGDVNDRQEQAVPLRKAPNGSWWTKVPLGPATPDNRPPAHGEPGDDQSATGSSVVRHPAKKLILVHRWEEGEVEPI